MTQSWNSRVFIALAGSILLTGTLGLHRSVHATEIRHDRFHQGPDTGDWLIPTGKGWGRPDLSGNLAKPSRPKSSSSNNGIFYHGGPLIVGDVKLYYIWYGNWTIPGGTGATDTILNTFGNEMGGTPYFGINTSYYDSNNVHVTGNVTMAGQTTDNYSQGTSLSDADIQTIVENAFNNGLSYDPNGVYFVLASKDVLETSGFCTQYCAWHTHGTINGNDVKYGFVGSPMQCPSGCSAQTTSPNGNEEADAMANLIAHELAESATDSDLNAWYDRRGYENADKCVWTFGSTSTDSNGAKYNVSWGSNNWLLQRNWINSGGGSCTLSN